MVSILITRVADKVWWDLQAVSQLEDHDVSDALIFVVDDDDLFRNTIRGIFESSDYLVQDYSSCEHFIEDYSPGKHACLLIDAHLPGMKGLELLHYLRRNGDELPAVMISGSSDVALVLAMCFKALHEHWSTHVT
ncbi:response regulator [Pseudomonas sp. PCH446]